MSPTTHIDTIANIQNIEIVEPKKRKRGRPKGFKPAYSETDPFKIKQNKIEIQHKTYLKRGKYICAINRMFKVHSEIVGEDYRKLIDTELYDYYMRVKNEYSKLKLQSELAKLTQKINEFVSSAHEGEPHCF
jgi:hypothetical protein